MTRDEILQSPYAGWLEHILPDVLAENPVSMCIVAVGSDLSTYTAYCDCSALDMTIMARAIENDRMVQWIRCNAGLIKDLLEEGEEDEDGDGDGDGEDEEDEEP